jgi:chemotaxis-related protein WspD
MSATWKQAGAVEACWQRTGMGGDGSCPELRQHLHCRNCPVHASAASALLDRDAPEGYLAEWTEQVARGSALSAATLDVARGKGERASSLLSVMVFRIGAEWLALPTTLLEEVTEPRPVHSLPHRRSGVLLGIANIHGELLICVSLALLLGLEPAVAASATRPAAAPKERFLVIGRDADRFVFLADEVQGIQRHAPEALRPPPATLTRALSSYSRQVLTWDGRTVGCLDGDLLLASLNRSIA